MSVALIWPLASVSLQPRPPDEFYRASLFAYHSYGDRTNWWATPLIGHHSEGGEAFSWILPLAWWEHDDTGNLDLRYLFGLGNLKITEHQFARSSLFPLYDCRATEDSLDVYGPLYLAHFGTSSEGSSGRLWPLASVSSTRLPSAS